MPTARWISRTPHLSESLSEKASGGSSQWTATISRSTAFTDGSALQSSHRRAPEYGSPLTRSARPRRAAQPSLARGRLIALASSGGSNPDGNRTPLSITVPASVTKEQLGRALAGLLSALQTLR